MTFCNHRPGCYLPLWQNGRSSLKFALSDLFNNKPLQNYYLVTCSNKRCISYFVSVLFVCKSKKKEILEQQFTSSVFRNPVFKRILKLKWLLLIKRFARDSGGRGACQDGSILLKPYSPLNIILPQLNSGKSYVLLLHLLQNILFLSQWSE